MKKILVPLPNYGADPTEAAVPWKVLSVEGYQLTFITPQGTRATLDQAMLNGDGLGVWKPLLQARADAVAACTQMQAAAEFCSPGAYDAVSARDFDALLLPGGHDKRVREYLESTTLQNLVVDFFRQEKPVAAICHGVVLAARSIDPASGKSVLYGYRTTALLKSQEMTAYNLTRLWLKDYYLTYPGLTVEDEVRSVLATDSDFLSGPRPLLRDAPGHLGRGYTVIDRNYLSARWPGDIYRFATDFSQLIASA